ncbi:recombination regulator RecX [Bacillus sp. DJP31]|uniref:recombination regulator RecX n=1 Tax=Bacillus sp. DJP31 TaxID=3409789 RepID=UPI003BB64A82
MSIIAIITKITTQKKNKERYNIFLDDGKGERYAFSVHESIIISHQLQKGKEIDELDIEEIGFADDVNRSFQQAIVFLSYRMRSTQEVIQNLKEKEYEDAIIQETIHKLRNINYLDDEAFAIAFVRTNSRVSLKGPVILKQELGQKGISALEIETALSHYTEEDQLAFATKIAEKTLGKTTSASEKMQKQKVTETLIRKGFSREIITLAMNELAPEKSEEEEWIAVCQTGAKAHRRYQKYKGREYEQKMKQYLFQKRFQVDLIERFFDSEEYKELTN